MSTSTKKAKETTTPAATPAARQFSLPPLREKDFNRAGKMGSNISIALKGLWANRLRTALTTLGIFIGVAAVIAAVIMTQGVSASITSTINSLGTNTITVASGSGSAGTRSPFGGGSGGGGGRSPFNTSATSTTPSITPIDAKSIEKVPNVTGVTPVISDNQRLVYGNLNWNTRVQGAKPIYQTIGNWTLAEGAWYTDSDEQGAKPVVILGPTVVNNLFPDSNQDPVGRSILIGIQPFRVIGIFASKGGDSDNSVIVPFSTALNRIKNTSYVDQIQVQVDDSGNIDSVQAELTTILRKNHHLTSTEVDDFNFTTSTQLLQTASQFTTTLTYLLVGIAAISLTVGGIGVMNIMIVSVTERTREIGIRISIGAQRQDIRNQFLIEALVLSLVGGIIGMIVGLLLGYGVTIVVKIPFVVSTTTLVAPFIISSAIGVGFGLYPAVRASRLDPIEALRSV